MNSLSTRAIIAITVSALVGTFMLLVFHGVQALRAPDMADAERATLAVDLAILGAGQAGLVIMLAIHLRELVFHRVEDGARIARRQAQGHLEERMPVDGPREVRELAMALNEMADASETRQRRMLHEAGASAMSAVLLGVAHEVRNPLAVMRLNTTMLPRQDPDYRRSLERIERGLDRLEEVVWTLQALEDTSAHATSDPNRIVRGALMALQGRMIDILPPQLDLAARHAAACSGSRLMQAVTPLILNAVEATSQGGRFSVRSRDEGDEVVLEIEDAGPGLPEQFGDILTEPFVTTKPGHVGLGLVMAKQVLDEVGGSLSLRSEAGTLAEVRLPAAGLADAGGPAGMGTGQVVGGAPGAGGGQAVSGAPPGARRTPAHDEAE